MFAMRAKLAGTVIAAFAAALLPLNAANASSLGIQLRVTVPVICHITDAYAPNPSSGEILLETNCNAEHYAISLGGDLSDIGVGGVSASQGRAASFGSQLSMQSDRPGRTVIRVQMNGDLSQVRSAYFNIQAL
ncbi:hypothetical protein [Blastomonas fulva]|uniref:hypothetical protein n=2 Tax=Blastomonas fulva TaxID=1550728 RepID=UPI0013C2CE4D|nr:hypothetical protein [Blastomonas fulva]